MSIENESKITNHIIFFDDFINKSFFKNKQKQLKIMKKFKRFVDRKEYNPTTKTKIVIMEQRSDCENY